MKFCAILLVIVVGLLSKSFARPPRNGMIMYRTAPWYYGARSAPLTQRLMYVQYVQPAQAQSNEQYLPSKGATAFVTGESVATGTYVNEYENGYQQHETEVQSAEIPEDVISTAQAVATDGQQFGNEFANEIVPQTDEIDEPNFEEVEPPKKEKGPREFVPIPENDQTTFAVPLDPVTASDVEEPATILDHTSVPRVESSYVPAPVPEVVPPKKKIRVELDLPEEDEYEEPNRAYVPVQRRPAKPSAPQSTNKPKGPSLPSGTFFPIHFGNTSGGAIAIANSFSTAEGGSATSHATAYGSPPATRFAGKRRIVQA